MRSILTLLTIIVVFALPKIFAQAPGKGPSVENSGKPSPTTKIAIPPEKASPVRVPKTETAIVIDGKLDEPVWQTAAVFKDFYQTSPGNNTAPSRPTEVYMFYDELHLYIGFKCWDERDKIRATVAKA